MVEPYIGRYAPSPSGDLHLGNLRTALLAWLHARLNGGRFLVRMEDLDLPRMVQGSDAQILKDIEWLGLDWDGEVVYQSARSELYHAALQNLESQGLVYECFCSRKDIRSAASAPHDKPLIYPGTCANLASHEREQKRTHKNPAFRVRVNAELTQDCGDFVIKRADSLFAYQLAVVVDDLDQGVSNVVRGQDLVDSTPRQRYLAAKLLPTAVPILYHHVPLLKDVHGKRMSKRDGSFSAREWQGAGADANTLVGEFAAQLGWASSAEPISAAELLDELTLDAVNSTFECQS